MYIFLLCQKWQLQCSFSWCIWGWNRASFQVPKSVKMYFPSWRNIFWKIQWKTQIFIYWKGTLKKGRKSECLWLKEIKMSHLMRLWHFSSSVNSFLKHACALAQSSNGARCLLFGRTFRLLPCFMFANSKGSGKNVQMHCSPEPSLVSYVISAIIWWAGSNILIMAVVCPHSYWLITFANSCYEK